MKGLLVIATLCMLLVGVGGIASLAHTTAAAPPPNQQSGHHPLPGYDLLGQGVDRKHATYWVPVGTIHFELSIRQYAARADLNLAWPANRGPLYVRGEVPGGPQTSFIGCATPDKDGHVSWNGKLTDHNVAWLEQYQKKGEYKIYPGCQKE